MARFETLRLALASLFCAALVAAPLPHVARAVGALPLVLYLPGRCWLAAALPGSRTDGETRVLATALSLALVTLLGLMLAHLTTLGPRPWLAGLAVVCVAACIVAAVAGRGSRTDARAREHVLVGPWRFLSLLVAIGLAGFAYWNASRGAIGQRPDLYTDFWIVPAPGQAPTVATAGVKNQEGRDAVYAIDVVARGAVKERINAFVLHPGETRTIQVALPRVVFAATGARRSAGTGNAAASRTRDDVLGADRVELRLFKDGNRNVAYRRVWVALPTTAADADVVDEATLPAGDLSYSGSAMDTLRASLRAVGMTGVQVSSRDLQPASPADTVRDATHRLDLSQAATLQAPDYDADAGKLGVAPDDPTDALRATAVAPRPADTNHLTSPE